jgi:hypothetical protein
MYHNWEIEKAARDEPPLVHVETATRNGHSEWPLGMATRNGMKLVLVVVIVVVEKERQDVDLLLANGFELVGVDA